MRQNKPLYIFSPVCGGQNKACLASQLLQCSAELGTTPPQTPTTTATPPTP